MEANTQWETEYLYTLKVSSHKTLTNNNGKYSNLTLQKPCSLTSLVSETYQYQVPP